ncbi:MAG: cation-transporting P-type ATPase [Candidatus Bathyarchaeota archaeon]|nr:cation-transporting P-type ATPase [Candidatus Bathyarchaeota archaeon]
MSRPPEKQPVETDANPQTGLTSGEAARRLAVYGPNRLVEEHEIHFLAILREEITEPMILLLLAIGILYGVINQGNPTDSLTIVAVVAVLVLVEVWNEYRAKKSITALKKLASPTTTVLRNGQAVQVPTQEVVVGDIVLLKVGERVPADAKLLDAQRLQVDESTLTGESFPVAKDANADEAGRGEKQNRVFAGTVIAKGHAKAAVTATGAGTELGKVAGITKAAKEPKTPLQLSMKQLSKTLIWIALFFSILIPVLSLLRGMAPTQAILYGLSLSFATVPEEMPIIITMVLGVGAFALSRKKAVVKRLRAAETLGSTTVIATDKTGTITESKMRVESLYFDGKVTQKEGFGPNEKEAVKTALLAAEAVENLSVNAAISNPMAQAILETVRESGFDIQKLTQTWVLKDEVSFDNKRKLASYIYQFGSGFILMSSGAPENILVNSTKILLQGQETELTDQIRAQAATAMVNLARSGQRLLAFGYRRITPAQQLEKQGLEQNLVFVGVVGFIDPPRKEVREAILTCQEAGIKVIMVTGDHPETARAVAAQVGIHSNKVLRGPEIAKMNDQELKAELKNTAIFARTTPEDKLRLVRLLRENGEIVAVTGDGVNDAPALKEAHIGIAMGIRGTDVARETADMVLADDNFATITTAVEEGRKIFANLRKGVRYYLACKIALVASFLLPIALDVPLPFAPIQIIVLELFMDLAASATFVAEPQEAGTMHKPPLNPKEKFMNKPMITTMALGALSLFAAVSTSYLFAWYTTGNLGLAQTMAFATWMVGHIFLALNFRSEQQPLVKLGLRSNKLMLLWALVVAVTIIAATSLPVLNDSLKTTNLGWANWAVVLAVSFTATFWMELKKLLKQ